MAFGWLTTRPALSRRVRQYRPVTPVGAAVVQALSIDELDMVGSVQSPQQNLNGTGQRYKVLEARADSGVLDHPSRFYSL
jgi:hypothetical protein